MREGLGKRDCEEGRDWEGVTVRKGGTGREGL